MAETTQPRNDWQRLRAVIQSTGLSLNAFAHSIGLPAAEPLLRIKQGEEPLSDELARRIAQHYPDARPLLSEDDYNAV